MSGSRQDGAAATATPAVPKEFGSVASRPLSEQISHEIVKSILRRDFTTGGVLPSEKELARQFDVSRAVVREAVKAVEMLGLIQRRQGRGTRVAPESGWRHLAPELLMARTEVGAVEDVLLELLELRRMVEVEAAALAARRATRADIAEMLQHLEQMEAALTDPDQFTQHDLAFHNAMLQATGNHLLRPLFEQLRPLLEFARGVSAGARPEVPAQSQCGHRALYKAIAEGNPEAAAAVMADHLSWTANLDLAERERRLEKQRRER